MRIFGTKLGCFIAFNVDGSSSRGAYMKLPSGGQLPETSLKSPVLVTSVEAVQKEAVGFLSCFNDTSYMYAFGHDSKASYLTIRYLALLVDGSEYNKGGGSGGGGALNNSISDLTGQYKQNRISQTQKKAQITLGGSSNVFQGYIIGMATSTSDPERNLQNFSMTLAMPECQT